AAVLEFSASADEACALARALRAESDTEFSFAEDPDNPIVLTFPSGSPQVCTLGRDTHACARHDAVPEQITLTAAQRDLLASTLDTMGRELSATPDRADRADDPAAAAIDAAAAMSLHHRAFHTALVDAKSASGKSGMQIAAAVGVHNSTIAAWLAGRRIPPRARIDSLV
ncbi:helix-turn-helix domain-containing protein, partial [Nocardia cyriacigeorgica]|uniref:helix-turn-helix domain-containing protein n=1 Tax=Nocardia cyriacigeorgica TaxID=135487 RepID=UPI001895E3D4